MLVVRYLAPLAAGLSLLLSPAPAQPAPSQPRSEIRALGANLDRAVRRVSRASNQAASSTTRSYLLPGIGALFVLPPQALPAARRWSKRRAAGISRKWRRARLSIRQPGRPP